MKKYHVATGDGKGYYGVGYELYRQAESLLRISQEHDPQAHIVEEEYHFTNADRIRAMNDEELAEFLNRVKEPCDKCQLADVEGACTETLCDDAMLKWLKQPAEECPL